MKIKLGGEAKAGVTMTIQDLDIFSDLEEQDAITGGLTPGYPLNPLIDRAVYPNTYSQQDAAGSGEQFAQVSLNLVGYGGSNVNTTCHASSDGKHASSSCTVSTSALLFYNRPLNPAVYWIR